MADGNERPHVRILSLDNGGVRGLSSLLILRELMARLAVRRGEQTVRPCDCFELIVGIGTGGLSALFLGRMGMSVDQAIAGYTRVANAAFQPQRTSAPSVLHPPKIVPFDGDALADAFGSIVERLTGDRYARFAAQPDSDVHQCYTVILATTVEDAQAPPFVFQSHVGGGWRGDSICEVAHATSAAGGLCAPTVLSVAVGDTQITCFSAGVAEYHNPSAIALRIAEQLLPGRPVACVVSLGTGLQTVLSSLNKDMQALADVCREVADNCEQVHEQLQPYLCDKVPSYFRFNVERGPHGVHIGEWRETELHGALSMTTHSYLQRSEVDIQLDSCVDEINRHTIGLTNLIPHASGAPQDFSHPERGHALRAASFESHEEPFSRRSRLCLDGMIHNQSEYVVTCGGFADIRTGSFQNYTVAIKTMRLFNATGSPIETTKLLKRLWREYTAWSKIWHPNILGCLGFSYDFTPQSGHTIPSLISRWMANGTVPSYIRENPDVDRLGIVLGIARGLEYLHGRYPPIVHGDLRAGNILVSDAGVPCLTDFGLSRIISDTRGMTTSSEVAGSLRWMAPELFDRGKLSFESDVWAFGMTVLEVFTGKRPFDELALEPQVMHRILRGQIPARPVHASAFGLTEKIWMVCQKCWRQQPARRPCLRDVLAEIASGNATVYDASHRVPIGTRRGAAAPGPAAQVSGAAAGYADMETAFPGYAFQSGGSDNGSGHGLQPNGSGNGAFASSLQNHAFGAPDAFGVANGSGSVSRSSSSVPWGLPTKPAADRKKLPPRPPSSLQTTPPSSLWTSPPSSLRTSPPSSLQTSSPADYASPFLPARGAHAFSDDAHSPVIDAAQCGAPGTPSSHPHSSASSVVGSQSSLEDEFSRMLTVSMHHARSVHELSLVPETLLSPKEQRADGLCEI